MFVGPNFFQCCKSFLVSVTVAERGQVGPGLRKIRQNVTILLENMAILLFFGTPIPTQGPTSKVFFLSKLIVEENVCNPCNTESQAHSSRDQTRKISRLNKKSCGFPRNSAGVPNCAISVAPRTVRKTNRSIEVGTSERRVLTFGLTTRLLQ